MIHINSRRLYLSTQKYLSSLNFSNQNASNQIFLNNPKYQNLKFISSKPLAFSKACKAFGCSNKYSFSNSVLKQAFNQFLDHPYSRLCRWEKPIGALLLFWPCLWGIQAGANNLLMAQSFIPLYFLFLMGSWTARSAGCIINDYLDKDFDKNVQRCKKRPLASGQVTTLEAGKLLFINLCGGLIVLSQMNISAIMATFMILPISALYPLAKRYIKHPQAVLASAFNSGIFICGLTVNAVNPSWEIITSLYLSGICWTMIYDTIYAFQDIEDDKKLGLKSTAIQWEDNIVRRTNQLLATSLLLTCSLTYFNPLYVYSLPFFIGAHAFLKVQLDKLDIKSKESCHKFFKKNNLFGMLIFLGLLLKRLIEEANLQKKQKSDKQTKTK